MLKTVLKVTVAFSLLLAGYAGYIRLFAVVSERVRPPLDQEFTKLVPVGSRTLRESIDLARLAFGPNHWASRPDLQIRFYNIERGYWMYAQSYKRLEDGKVLEFEPFALISRSKDKKKLHTMGSKKCRLTLDQPLGLGANAGTSSLHIINAKLEEDVVLTDNKGTPKNHDDDLVIGPMTYVEYDEPTLQIKSDSDVVIQDRDMRATGTGLKIDLWPKEEGVPGSASGFNGARTMFLYKNVHIVMQDAGSTGFLSGTAQPPQKKGAKTPLDVRCADKMRVDLPKPRVPLRANQQGPPAPPGPTYVEFTKIVEVARGKLNAKEKPDLLFCDNLYLTLTPNPPAAPVAKTASQAPTAKPAPKPVAKTAAADGEDEEEEESTSGPLSDLALRRAVATGHSVQLLSPSQGMTVRGNELIHDKLMPKEPDKTYFRGDRGTLLQVEKISYVNEGPDKGKVDSVTFIRTIDATVFQDDRGSEYATVDARGPGIMELRKGMDKPVEQTAVWQDELVLQPYDGPEKKVHKKITLTGFPRFHDIPAKTSLDARTVTVIRLRPKAQAPAPPPKTKTADGKAPAPAPQQGGGFEIENLVALDDVHLISPTDHLTARQRLDAWFKPAPVTANPAAQPAPAATPAPAAEEPKKDDEPKKPDKPSSKAIANRVEALIVQRPDDSKQPSQPARSSSLLSPGAGGSKSKSEVQLAKLMGAVTYHQDPEPGEERGTDVTGERIDLSNQGDGQWMFQVYQRDPQIADLFLGEDAFKDAAHRSLLPPAHVITKDMDIQGEVVGLDQKTDYAFVDGPGQLIMMTERNLMNDEPVKEGEQTKEKGQSQPKPKTVQTKGRTNPPPQPSPLAADRPTNLRSGSLALSPRERVAAQPPGEGASGTGRAYQEDALTRPLRGHPLPGGEGGNGSGGQPVAGEGRVGGNHTQTSAKSKTQAKTAAKTKDQAKDDAEPPKKLPLTITWKTGMEFFGKPASPDEKPVARAEFFTDVKAEMEDRVLICEEMKTYFDKTVKLARQKPAPQPAEDGELDLDAEEQPKAEPKADVVFIECYQNVTAISRKVDPTRTRLLQQQRIEGNFVTYDKRTGNFHVPGAGTVYLWNRDGETADPSMQPGPAAPAPIPGTRGTPRRIIPTANPNPPRTPVVVGSRTGAKPPTGARTGPGAKKGAGAARPEKNPGPPKPFKMTQIRFSDQMLGKMLVGQKANQTDPDRADFFGNVETVSARVTDVRVRIDYDKPPEGYGFLTAQTLRVVGDPLPADAPADTPKRYFMTAWQNAHATRVDMTLAADKITYDSSKELYYAYGLDGRLVELGQQKGPGQPWTVSNGKTAIYNQGTGEGEMVDPKSIQLVDAKSGFRPVAPEKPKPDQPKTRKRTRMPSRNSMDRKGMTGK